MLNRSRHRIWFAARIFMASVTTSIILGALLVGLKADFRVTADPILIQDVESRLDRIEADLKHIDEEGKGIDATLNAQLALIAEQRLQIEKRQAIIETQIDNIIWLLRGTALGVIGLIIEVVFRLRRQSGRIDE